MRETELRDFQAVVLDLETVERRLGRPVHGLLGFPLLAHDSFELRLAEDLLLFRRPDERLEVNVPVGSWFAAE